VRLSQGSAVTLYIATHAVGGDRAISCLLLSAKFVLQHLIRFLLFRTPDIGNSWFMEPTQGSDNLCIVADITPIITGDAQEGSQLTYITWRRHLDELNLYRRRRNRPLCALEALGNIHPSHSPHLLISASISNTIKRGCFTGIA
jgi:hypothetical protein